MTEVFQKKRVDISNLNFEVETGVGGKSKENFNDFVINRNADFVYFVVI